MLQLLQAFGGPGRTALSFAPTYSMYPEYARDSVTAWVVGHRGERLLARPRPRARPRDRERQPSVVLLPSPNNPTGTALPLDAVDRAVRGGRRRDRRGRRGVRRVPSGRHAQRARAAPATPQPGRQPHDEQGVRAGRRPGRLPRRGPRDLRRAPGRAAAVPPQSAVTQATALAALRHAPELLGKVDELRAERDATVAWLRDQGLEVADSDANFALFGTLPPTGTRSGRGCSTGAC